MKKVLLVTFSDNADHQDTLFGMYEEMRNRSDWDAYLLCIKTPKVEHTELSLNASPLEYIVLGVAGIEILFGKSDSSYAIFNCRKNRERMVTLLHMLLAEADRSLDGCETVCQDLLEVLLIWLVR